MKAVILTRVSTKEQEDGHSLSAQKERLVNYCKRKEMNVVKIFEIIESSTIGGRKKFYEMIEFIKKQNGKIALIADAIDRVQRAFTDSIPLEKLRTQGKIEIHFLREGIILNETSKGTDIIRWDYSVIGAKTYVLNISDNVKRSTEYKLRNGEWIGAAPLGYLNAEDHITGKKTVILDKQRDYLIKKSFELYATGIYSLTKIHIYLKENGLKNRKSGKPITRAQIHNILQNHFYYGVMKVKGELYIHTTIKQSLTSNYSTNAKPS